MMSSWQRRAAAVAALAVPALVVAGCTSTTPGTTSLGTSTSTSAATGGPASGSGMPTSGKSARPRSIDLRNVDPCQILTPQQRQQLGFDRPVIPAEDTKTYGGISKLCHFRDSVHNTGGLLSVVTTFGIGTFTDGSRPSVQPEPTQVAGFPALVLRSPGVTDTCKVVVDVADGQFLMALFDDIPQKLPNEQICQGARQVAEAAMASLKGGG